MSRVLVVGRRRKCYRAALDLGHETFLWSDGPLHESRKKKLSGWIEEPFSENEPTINQEILDQIQSFKIEYVVAATESSVNLAAKIRENLSLSGTSYRIANLLHNKNDMKKMAQENDIPVTRFHLVTSTDDADILIDKLGLPLVLKPVSDSGARGVVVAMSKEEVSRNMNEGLLAEAFVEGSEVSVETFVHDGEPIFHNITDYVHQWRKSILPAELEESLKSKIISINDKVIKSFGVKSGMTHAEFYLTKSGPLFGEMAVRPPGGYYMELIEEAYGFDPWSVYVKLETDMDRPNLDISNQKFAGVYIIYPDPGKVQAIGGLPVADEIPEIFEFKFKLKLNDTVDPHDVTSNEVGHVFLSSDNSKRIRHLMTHFDETINIEVECS